MSSPAGGGWFGGWLVQLFWKEGVASDVGRKDTGDVMWTRPETSPQTPTQPHQASEGRMGAPCSSSA